MRRQKLLLLQKSLKEAEISDCTRIQVTQYTEVKIKGENAGAVGNIDYRLSSFRSDFYKLIRFVLEVVSLIFHSWLSLDRYFFKRDESGVFFFFLSEATRFACCGAPDCRYRDVNLNWRCVRHNYNLNKAF